MTQRYTRHTSHPVGTKKQITQAATAGSNTVLAGYFTLEVLEAHSILTDKRGSGLYIHSFHYMLLEHL